MKIHITYQRKYMTGSWRKWLINFSSHRSKTDSLYELTILGFLIQILEDNPKGEKDNE